MKLKIKLFVCFFMLYLTGNSKCIKVNDITGFNKVVKTLMAGDSIALSNGKWKDAQLVFKGKGEKNRYISLVAETPGKVTLEGSSSLRLSGDWLWISGLVFTNGYTPGKTVVDFRTGTKEYAFNTVLSNCSIDKYNQSDKKTADHWVELWGKNNRVEYCYFGGKTNEGTTLVIWPNDSNCINNHHLVTHNYFGARPPLGFNGGETIRIGTSDVCTQPSASIVSYNYFEHCNGEVEIISNKSCENQYLNNTFFECEGCLTLRHGNNAEVAGNWFIGNKKKNTGGVRIINEGHRIYNNFFYQLNGENFLAALSIMNAIPDSPANGYAPVKDVIVANNSFIDCHIPWNFCTGANERNRTVRPENTLLINNLVYCPKETTLFISMDERDGIAIINNLMINESGFYKEPGSVEGDIIHVRINDFKIVTTSASAKILPSKRGYNKNAKYTEKVIGAYQSKDDAFVDEFATAENCGPSWYRKKE